MEDLGIPENIEDLEFDDNGQIIEDGNPPDAIPTEEPPDAEAIPMSLEDALGLPGEDQEQPVQTSGPRTGRRRSESIDYGSRGGGSGGAARDPEQELYDKSLAILLSTQGGFSREAEKFVNPLNPVKSPEEIKAEETYDIRHDESAKQVLDRELRTLRSYKVVVCGDTGVGKTSLIERMVKNDVNKSIVASAGVNYTTTILHHELGDMQLIMCDLSGQERLHDIITVYMKNVNAALLVVDMTDASSLDALESYYLRELDDCHPGQFFVFVVGNKIDGTVVVSKRAIFELLKKYPFEFEFFEASAKAGTNVPKILKAINRKMHNLPLKQNQCKNSG